MGDAIVRQMPQAVTPAQVMTFTPEQRQLIRSTVASACANDDEFALFLHVAQRSGLDPLLRQIHAIKLQGRLSFVADINGLQARAAREADYEGIEHGVVFAKDVFDYDHKAQEILAHRSNPFANGEPVGAWAVVYRKGKRPFRSLVSFREYLNPNNPLWKSKPAVMIDKVAKSTALRLAYPEQLGNLYAPEELDAEEEREINNQPKPAGSRTAQVAAAVAAKVAGPQTAQEMREVVAEVVAEAPKSSAWQRIQRLWNRNEMEWSVFCALVKDTTGKGKDDLDENDVALVQEALRQPPTDDDAPPTAEEVA